jgi:hypothetical protein
MVALQTFKSSETIYYKIWHKTVEELIFSNTTVRKTILMTIIMPGCPVVIVYSTDNLES